jgi:hypothetical protein
MILLLKVILQALAVTVAVLGSILSHVISDKNSRTFRTWRLWLFVTSGIFLLASIAVTVNDSIDTKNREVGLQRKLDKVQSQNDGLQKALSVLSQDQKLQFGSLLKEQQEVGAATALEIKGSASLLHDRMESFVGLLNKSAQDIDRAANPIHDIAIDVDLTTKLEMPCADGYRNRFQKAVLDLSKQDRINEIGELFRTPENELQIYIRQRPYLPDKDSESAVYYALNYMYLTVDLYKSSVPVQELISDRATPAMQLSVAGSVDRTLEKIDGNRMSTWKSFVTLCYYAKDRRFHVSARGLIPIFQHNTGEIIAIPDLLGSWLVLRLGRGFGGTDNPNINSGIKEIYRSMRIEDLAVEMSGRRFDITGNDLRKYTDGKNQLVYIYQFPRNNLPLKNLTAGQIE